MKNRKKKQRRKARTKAGNGPLASILEPWLTSLHTLTHIIHALTRIVAPPPPVPHTQRFLKTKKTEFGILVPVKPSKQRSSLILEPRVSIVILGLFPN